MTRNLLFIFLIFSSYHSECQEWIRIYGQGKDAVGRYIIETYDRGYMINASCYKGNHSHLWLFKTDINGNILWEKKVETGDYSFYSLNVEQVGDGGYILCGSTTRFGSYDAYILKLNSCAEIEWCKVLISPNNYDLGIKVKPTPEGDYLLLGEYFQTEPESNTSLFKFNSTGDLIWQQFYPLDSLYYNDELKELIVDYDGYLILTDRYYPDPGQYGGGTLRSNFIKTDTAGNQLWNTVYVDDGYYYSRPWGMRQNQYGNYYTACTHTVYSSGDNPAIIKVLHNGDQSYNKDIMTTGTFNLSGMATVDFLNDTNLVMFGAWIVSGIKSNVVVKTDTLGNLRKTKVLIEVPKAFMNAVKTFDNKFVSIANDPTGATWKIYAVKVNSDLEYDSIYTQPFTYDSLCPYPIVSDTVDPDCDNVYVGIDEPFKNPETTKLKVYPNPATDFITIEMPKYLVATNTSSRIPSTTIYHQWGSAILEIYDLFGKKLFEKEIIRSETTLTIDVSQWSKGMYLCRVVFNKQTVASEKILIE